MEGRRFMCLGYVGLPREIYIEEFAQLQYFFESNHPRCSVRKGVLRDFANFAGKHLYQSLFFNKVAGLRHKH